MLYMNRTSNNKNHYADKVMFVLSSDYSKIFSSKISDAQPSNVWPPGFQARQSSPGSLGTWAEITGTCVLVSGI